MIYLSGIGNSKNIMYDLINEKGEATLILYDIAKLQTISASDFLILAYDGLGIDEFFKILPDLSEVQYIPVFVTQRNILVFGMNSLEEKNDKLYACPYCVAKQSMNDLFPLKLYKFLFEQTNFKAIKESYGLEFKHFFEILQEMIKKNILASHVLNYSLLGNTYSFERKNGLSKCHFCDEIAYDNESLHAAIKGVL